MRTTARRLAGSAVVASLLAVVALAVAVQPTTDAGSADDGWVAGVLLVFAPTFAAAVTTSVSSSSLLRPVGVPVAVLGALAAALHVAIAVDERGGVGWLLSVPAVMTIALLVVALVLGPSPRTARESGTPLDLPPEPAMVTGPPLDVLGALWGARAHASREVAAWVIVLVLATVLTPLALLALGWPRVIDTVEARVLSVNASDVVLVAEHAGRTITWSYERTADSQWELGDRRRAHIDDEGRVHLDAQFGLADAPLVFSLAFVALFLGLAVRRIWGLMVATFDAGRGDDRPRLGHVALVRPYRSWRPLAAVWWRDPTAGDRLAPPDAVYRADDDAAEEMRSDSSTVVVHRAWIDTGFKPRWIAAENGVVIPHRRALLGRWHVRAVTRRAEIADLVELHHAAPAFSPVLAGQRSSRNHRLVPMVAWRMLAIPAAIAVPFLAGPGGEPMRQLR